MPLYDFKCTVCSSVHERLVKHNDSPPKCRECEEPTERCIPRTGGFVLKGTGWYETDFKGTTNDGTN